MSLDRRYKRYYTLSSAAPRTPPELCAPVNLVAQIMLNKPHSLIVSGFPGIGKSTVAQNSSLRVQDSDSSKFPKDGFPANYIEHIQATYHSHDITLVSSQQLVREALVAAHLDFWLVYPKADLKHAYLRRYARRLSPPNFIKMMDENWDSFIESCEAQTGAKHIRLESQQYLENVIGGCLCLCS